MSIGSASHARPRGDRTLRKRFPGVGTAALEQRLWAPLAGLLMLLVVGPASSLAALPAKPARPYELVPGAIVDPRGCRLYMMDPGGGINALEIGSGRLAWRQAQAAMPLALDGPRLVAEAQSSPRGELRLLLLDTAAGAPERTLTVPLAPNAIALLSASPSRSFEIQARMSGGKLDLRWHYLELRRAGAYRSHPHIITHASGESRVDLDSGTVANQPIPASDFKTAWMPSEMTDFPPAGGLSTAPRQVGDTLVATKVTPAGGRVQTTVYRWDAVTGAPLAPLTWPGPLGWNNFSADGGYFLTSTSHGRDPRRLPIYALAAYAIRTRAAIAEITAPVSRAPFLVCGTTLVYQLPPARWHDNMGWHVRPLELRAFDLKRQRELWNRRLRDINFHYSPPPAAAKTSPVSLAH